MTSLEARILKLSEFVDASDAGCCIDYITNGPIFVVVYTPTLPRRICPECMPILVGRRGSSVDCLKRMMASEISRAAEHALFFAVQNRAEGSPRSPVQNRPPHLILHHHAFLPDQIGI